MTRGDTITLSEPLKTRVRIDVPEPAVHYMTMLTDVGSGPLRFAKDYVGVDYHNDGHTHIDAFSHVAFEGRPFDGKPASGIGERGARDGAIEVLKNGLVGRGVLLDIPQVRGEPWVEPGEHVFSEDLEAAEQEQGVRVEAGDILLIRTGHTRRLAELGRWDTRESKAGLHPSAARFLSDRRIAALGSDGNNDTAPSTTEGVGSPIHVLALNANGRPSLRLPSARGAGTALRDGCALGVPVRRGPPANRRRDRVAGEPDRHLLSFTPTG